MPKRMRFASGSPGFTRRGERVLSVFFGRRWERVLLFLVMQARFVPPAVDPNDQRADGRLAYV